MTSHNHRHQTLAFVITLLGALALLSWSRNDSLELQVPADKQSEWGIRHE